MQTAAQYLDAAKEKLQLQSDYALAKQLGLSRQTISNYRKNHRTFDNYTCIALSEITGIPALKIIADMELARETDECRRGMWESYVKRLGGSVRGRAGQGKAARA